MSWLRSLLLVCVMTLVLYGVYAWLVGGPNINPAPPPELADQGATVDPPKVDTGTESSDPYNELAHDGHKHEGHEHNGLDPDANMLNEGERENPPGTSIGELYGQADPTTSGAGNPFPQSPDLAGTEIAANAGSRYGADNAAGDNHERHDPGDLAGSPPQNTHDRFQADIIEANRLIAENRLAEAHLMLSQWHNHERLFADDQKQLYEYLDGLAGAVVYSPQHLLEPEYQVQVGETLATIADEYQVPPALLGKINGIDPQIPLTPGTVLKVIRGPFSAEVNLKRMELTVFLGDGRYAGRFNIGVGQEVPPKEGMFIVGEKVENPNYYKNSVLEVPGGDPNNPFGKKLLTLGDELALHGTNDPQSIGPRPCKEGCIRLGQRDINDVFDILSEGSQVRIIR